MLLNFFTANFYTNNRKKLISKLNNNSLAILFSNCQKIRTSNQYFPFRQNSDLLYLSGIEQEKTILLIHKKNNLEVEEIIFIIEPNIKTLIWEGEKITKSECKTISGISNIKFINEYKAIFDELIQNVNHLYINNFEKHLPTFKSILNIKNLKFEIINLTSLISSQRIIKQDEEIATIKESIQITRNAFLHLLKKDLKNKTEFEIEAEITYEFIKNRASGHAYLPIIASGKNACILHYIKNNSICKPSELLLMDFGAEFNNYASDCSRTIPINGKFNQRQKDCYIAVLNVFNAFKSNFKIGVYIKDIYVEVVKALEEEFILLGLFSKSQIKNQNPEEPLFKKYFMHGISHHIGLDVHDSGKIDNILEKNMFVSFEPGLYIPSENIGIRIENNILIDSNPIDLMEDIPYEINDIENLMQKR